MGGKEDDMYIARVLSHARQVWGASVGVGGATGKGMEKRSRLMALMALMAEVNRSGEECRRRKRFPLLCASLKLASAA